MLYSCVGTVQETNTTITDISSNYTPILTFLGLQSATAISDTKAELFFYPAAGGSGKYIYDIYVGNKPDPISVPSDILTPDYRGLLRFTVTGLTRMSTYLFTIQVREQNSNGVSNTQVVKQATTFDNRVADFIGIASAANMPGQDGKDSILIRYTPASYSGSLVAEEWDPASYELIVVDAERLTPADMDTNYSSAEGRWVFQWAHDKDNTQNEYIAKGLLPKRKYYARIRALHNGSVQDVLNPNKRSELNTKYVEISTLSDDLSDISFDSSSFTLSLPSGALGLNTMLANWNQAEGVFDHFRLYYGKKGSGVSSGSLPDLCLSETQSEPTETVFCKSMSYLSTSTQITGLDPYSEYEAVLVVCQTTECLSNARLVGVVREVTTDPATIFNGISSISASESIEGAETLKITYEDPSVVGGYFDGLILKMRRTVDGTDPEVEITENTTPVFYRPFDALSTTEIIVEGIDYLASEPYCFRLYPYKWNEDGSQIREIENENWKCILPKVEPPDATAFLGIESGSSVREYVTLRWSPPTSGFYTNYVIFWRKGSSVFNWGEAMAAFNDTEIDNGYDFRIIDGDKKEFTLEGFEDGLHTFGILTYHLYVSETEVVEKWSDTNTRFLKCNINNSTSDTINCGL
ncbi:MAG TPA: hypothetical protein VKZ84_03115 [Bacteriovoracaceae bacterium]|nr:hypothetical protein [Bacteriovoracaceae bacterium]